MLVDPTSRKNMSFEVLRWEEALPPEIQKAVYDVVLLADCTYNAGSAPALVETLAAIASRSCQTLIIVATKPRHPSESIFFELIEAAGIQLVEELSIPLPSVSGYAGTTVDMYAFRQGRQ